MKSESKREQVRDAIETLDEGHSGEVAAEAGVSESTARRHLRDLYEEGILDRRSSVAKPNGYHYMTTEASGRDRARKGVPADD